MNEIVIQASIYLGIALIVSMLTIFIFKVRIVGRYWVGFVVAYVGSLIGGIVNFLFKNNIFKFFSDFYGVNIFASLFFAVAFILILRRISKE
ncbi:MAG: hypothetical protein JXR63_10115 [Spirochaetales bacterium]|nr:hypothetical protein [Spirochaetales bacterium]